MTNRALLELGFFINSQRGLSRSKGVNNSWMRAMTDVKANIHRHRVALARAKPTTSANKMPIVKKNCVIVPSTPRRLGGATVEYGMKQLSATPRRKTYWTVTNYKEHSRSPKYIGTNTVEAPDERPITARAIMITYIDPAIDWIAPPMMKSHVIKSKVPLLPLNSAQCPAKTQPNGAPTQKAETARLHSSALCPGKTKASGAFITLILYPAKDVLWVKSTLH
jgi:hypothetical protein